MTDRPAQGNFSPFIVRFAEPLTGTPQCALRYDGQRQLSQVFVNGMWVDVPDAPVDAWRSTMLTKVKPETTDEA